MRKGHDIGLIASGKLIDSPLLRLWTARERLGPVKAPSVRVASRISNSLRAGHPVADYSPFEECELILISMPDALVPGIILELANVPLTWNNKAVVLCSGLHGANELGRLTAAGASAGSFCPIPGFEDRWFLLEGDKLVEARIKQIVDERHTRLTLIRPGCKPLYVTGVASTSFTLMPMLMRAGDLLRQAGVPVIESEAILEMQVQESMRSYFRAGRKAHRIRGPMKLSAQVGAQHS